MNVAQLIIVDLFVNLNEKSYSLIHDESIKIFFYYYVIELYVQYQQKKNFIFSVFFLILNVFHKSNNCTTNNDNKMT